MLQTPCKRCLSPVALALGVALPFSLVPDAAAQSAPPRISVVVTGNPLGSDLIDMVPPVSVIAGERLQRLQQPTLGEITATMPGVTSSYFGPNASRPVIRGLEGERVRILQNGLGVLDASGTSPDHAVALDTLTMKRIEIVRGPATLLYGPSAIGGVVNVIDRRIADEPIEGVTGAADVRYASAATERAIAASIDAGHGGLQLHLDAAKRRTDDLRIPDFAWSPQRRALFPPEDQGPRGTLPNSASDSDSAAIGASYANSRGFGGASYQQFDSDYGTVAEETVTIQLKRKRFDAAAEIRDPFAGAKSIRFRYGHTDYRHTEFEADEVGTVFDLDGHEARIDVAHSRIGPFEGAVGVQSIDYDFSALGEEAFVPSTKNRLGSLFVYEELRHSDWRFQFGGRYDRSSVRSADSEGFGPGETRTFDTGSGSVGVLWNVAPDYVIAASYVYSQRPPNYQELFANGPHVATGQFEIGDRALDVEKSSGIDIGLRKRNGNWSGSVTLFYNRFSDYIGLFPTGETEDDLPVSVYRQTRAKFYGAEAEGRIGLGRAAGGQWDLELQADWLRATDESTGEPLPRIAPVRFGGALAYTAERWDARLDVLRVQKQDRVAPNELPTDGYTMVNLTATARFGDDSQQLTIFLQGVNLLDEDARTHASTLKDIAPLGRRAIVVGLRASF